MSTTEATVPCERAYCAEPAEYLASRIDAGHDHIYLCESHAAEPFAGPQITTESGARFSGIYEVSALYGRIVPAITALAWWPPKHRTITRQAAKRLLAQEAAR